MAFTAGSSLYAGSDTISLDELDLYHALNDARQAAGLSTLKPVYDLTVISGQHAGDFESNYGFLAWSQLAPEARPIASLHQWSGGSYMDGVVSVARGFNLTLPTEGLAENAEGRLAQSVISVAEQWVNNAATRTNLFAGNWNAIGVGSSGDLTYVQFGDYADSVIASLSTPAIIGTDGGDRIRTTAWADRIFAGAGNDVFFGVSNGDRLDGGNGLDRVEVAGSALNYRFSTVELAGERWTAVSGDGTEFYIRNVEYIRFADQVVDSRAWGESLTLVGFDAGYYLARNPDIAALASTAADSGGSTAGVAAAHYWAYGQSEGRSPAAFFDTGYYLAHNPDVAAAVAAGQIGAFEHFLLDGQFEDRRPNGSFDSADYLALNPDIAAAVEAGVFASGLDHYLRYGHAEGRATQFDESFYLRANPDVAAAVTAGAFDSGLTHFRLLGFTEGRAGYDLAAG